MTKLYQVTLPYACFGVEVDGFTIVNATPIGRWMINKSLDFVTTWVKRKGGSVDDLQSTT